MAPVSNPTRQRIVASLIEVGRDREAARLASARPTLGGSMDPLTQFDLLGPALGGVIAGLGPDDLARPTACADFTVGGVLAHMVGGATAFAAAYRGQEPAVPDLDDVLGAIGPALEDLGAALHEPGALDTTVAAPFGEVPGETFARFVVLDGLVHGWDLATATGQVYDPPAALVEAADAFARTAIDPLRDGTTFGAAVTAADGATPIEQLAAYTGRTPV
jgi:uncharacterized protein (TIGR03086 family)